MKRIKSNIDKIRDSIAWITSSNIRNSDFGTFCQASGNMPPRTFALDMPIRWNSTYLMLESCLPYAKLITAFVMSRQGPHILLDRDWQLANKFYNFLKTFYDATVKLSGVYYPTSPLIIHTIIDISMLFDEYRYDENLREVVQSMEIKFKKYWKPLPFLYCLATILDPRLKIGGLEKILSGLTDLLGEDYMSQIVDIQNSLVQIFFQYQDRYGVQVRPNPSPAQQEQQANRS